MFICENNALHGLESFNNVQRTAVMKNCSRYKYYRTAEANRIFFFFFFLPHWQKDVGALHSPYYKKVPRVELTNPNLVNFVSIYNFVDSVTLITLVF